jgi:hypothetical protein
VCKFVLVGLANHAGPDGMGAFPSVATLVRYTGLSERTVRVRVWKARGMVMLPVVEVPMAGSDKMEVSSPLAGGTTLRAWLPLPTEPPRLPLQPGA